MSEGAGAQNRLIIEYDYLVGPIAMKFRGGAVDIEDLLSAGQEGLVKAARSFNPNVGVVFATWANTKIESEIQHLTRSKPSEWFPKETDAPLPILDGDKIEKIFEWDAWGDRGNASGICERWTKLDASPEELLEMQDELKDRRDRFAASFISLTSIERKLVSAVYLHEPQKPLAQAARDIGISYWRAVRSLKKALKTMRNVLERMEINRSNKKSPLRMKIAVFTSSGSNIAKGRPSLSGSHGCAPGNDAA